MAAIASVRYFLLICFHLFIDVRPLAFGEPVYEECFGAASEKDDRPVAFRFSLPWSGNPLFYDVTTKISVDLALFGAMDSLSQGRILDPSRNSAYRSALS
jgi:hypothetical protein